MHPDFKNSTHNIALVKTYSSLIRYQTDYKSDSIEMDDQDINRENEVAMTTWFEINVLDYPTPCPLKVTLLVTSSRTLVCP